MVLQLGVDRGDRAAEGRDQLAHRAHRLDLAERLALLDLVPDVRDLDGDHLAKLVLSVLGESEPGACSFDAHPQVVLGELQRISHGGFPDWRRRGTSWADFASITSARVACQGRPPHGHHPRSPPPSAPRPHPPAPPTTGGTSAITAPANTSHANTICQPTPIRNTKNNRLSPPR